IFALAEVEVHSQQQVKSNSGKKAPDSGTLVDTNTMSLKDTVKYIQDAIGGAAAHVVDFEKEGSDYYYYKSKKWSGHANGKSFELKENYVIESRIRGRFGDGSPYVETGDEYWTTSFIDFGDVDYHSVVFKTVKHSKTTLAN